MFICRRPLLSLLLPALVLAAMAMPAHAQLVGGMRAGSLPVTVPGQRRVSGAVPRLRRDLPDVVPEAASRLGNPRLERLLRRHPKLLDVDPAGAPVVRSEVVAIDPSVEALQLARVAGFSVGDERTLQALGLRVVVLRSPEGTGTRAALQQLRRLDPSGSYDFNHLYSGAAGAMAAGPVRAPVSGPAAPAVRIGLIDSGVARGHPALAGVDVHSWGCDGAPVADAHGTAVASLLMGAADGGAASGGTLFAADIYCGRPTGGAVTGYAEAMAWLAQEGVGVINLSLVGPHNALLRRATEALAARGHVLVAAVGNDGPAAPPLFPAAYPEVMGVTAVDRRQRALPEAGRGVQVDFAALGSELRAARPDGLWGTVRGTSFAAPLVARAAAAAYLVAPDPARAAQLRAQMAERARDLGTAGRDDTYGHGLVAPAAATGSR
ncbi:S8 family serine peptidase [Lysobacter sp. D1-1-M9]|uniref:S8 family serine peptidase n=1 Tax=Novilysobacter longmucuonensis TaxID=3098603 RepID=UPI0039836EE9